MTFDRKGQFRRQAGMTVPQIAIPSGLILIAIAVGFAVWG